MWCNAETLARETRALGVETVVSPFTILLHWEPPRFALRRWWRQVHTARALIRRHGIRLLHANSAAPNQWLLPAARSEALPLLVQLHAPYVARDRYLLGLHQATLVVGVTRGCVDGLASDGVPPARLATVYNGVDPEVAGRGDERGLRARLGIPEDAPVLARVGSLIPRKGVDALLRVVARLRADRPAVHLLVVGEGPERASLERLAHALGLDGAVHFLGFVPSSGAVLRDAADVLISPSRMEGFGLTVIEAGLFAKPVVATRTTGMDEILRSGENGILVPTDDEAAMLGAVRRLVDAPDERARLGSALARTVSERFLVTHSVAALERRYAELLALDRTQLGWRGTWSPPRVYARGLRRAVGLLASSGADGRDA